MEKEREKAKKQKEIFLKALKKMKFVSAACQKTKIPKSNIYRWKQEDPEFTSKIQELENDKYDEINDLAEHTIVQSIREGNIPAAKFYLIRRHPNYMTDPFLLKRSESKQTMDFNFTMQVVPDNPKLDPENNKTELQKKKSDKKKNTNSKKDKTT
jgi:hypothetical protein